MIYPHNFKHLAFSTSNKWTRKYLNHPTNSFKLSLIVLGFLSALMRSMIKPEQDHTLGKRQKKTMGNGPPPGCSARALVSTWLCPLSASQRAAEWGSIETNSFCQTQLMGFPRSGRKKAVAGLWLQILLRKHARNLPPGILLYDNNYPPHPAHYNHHHHHHPLSKPTTFSVHTDTS